MNTDGSLKLKKYKKSNYGLTVFLPGTDNLEAAIDNAIQRLTEAGLDVSTDPVVIRSWTRGEESGWLTSPRRAKLNILGLGWTPGTGPEGIESEVVVVESFDDLTAKSSQVC